MSLVVAGTHDKPDVPLTGHAESTVFQQVELIGSECDPCDEWHFPLFCDLSGGVLGCCRSRGVVNGPALRVRGAFALVIVCGADAAAPGRR